MVDMSAAVLVVLAPPEVTQVKAVEVEKDEEGAHEKIIRDGDQEGPAILKDSPHFGKHLGMVAFLYLRLM